MVDLEGRLEPVGGGGRPAGDLQAGVAGHRVDRRERRGDALDVVQSGEVEEHGLATDGGGDRAHRVRRPPGDQDMGAAAGGVLGGGEAETSGRAGDEHGGGHETSGEYWQ